MNRYFVTEVYSPAGTRKIEDILYGHAREEFLNMLVSEDKIQDVMNRMEVVQDEIVNANPRLKKVEIRKWTVGWSNEHIRIGFGQCSMSLTLVAGEYR